MLNQDPSIEINRKMGDNDSWNRVVVVLDGCVVELGQSIGSTKKRLRQNLKKDSQNASVLDGEANKRYISDVLRKNPALYRLDIIHHCLLQLLDSPLCMAGLLEIYLKLECGDLVRVDPRFDCPIVFDEFKLILAELLVFKQVKAAGDKGRFHNQKPLSLLRIVKNPLTDHLPKCQDRVIYLLNYQENAHLVDLHELIQPTIRDVLPKDDSSCVRELILSPVFIVGGFNHGTINVAHWKKLSAESSASIQEIKVCDSEISGGACCAMITHEYERSLGV